MADNMLAKPLDVVALEAEERLAALSDQAARFAELVAAGNPVDEAYARAGFTDGSVESLLARADVVAAVGALRERNLGDGPTDKAHLRKLLLGAAHFAFRDKDHRGVVGAVKLLAELDAHIERKPAPSVNVDTGGGGIVFMLPPERPRPVPPPHLMPAADTTVDVTPPSHPAGPPLREGQDSDLAGWLRATEPKRKVRTAGGSRLDPLS